MSKPEQGTPNPNLLEKYLPLLRFQENHFQLNEGLEARIEAWNNLIFIAQRIPPNQYIGEQRRLVENTIAQVISYEPPRNLVQLAGRVVGEPIAESLINPPSNTRVEQIRQIRWAAIDLQDFCTDKDANFVQCVVGIELVGKASIFTLSDHDTRDFLENIAANIRAKYQKLVNEEYLGLPPSQVPPIEHSFTQEADLISAKPKLKQPKIRPTNIPKSPIPIKEYAPPEQPDKNIIPVTTSELEFMKNNINSHFETLEQGKRLWEIPSYRLELTMDVVDFLRIAYRQSKPLNLAPEEYNLLGSVIRRFIHTEINTEAQSKVIEQIFNPKAARSLAYGDHSQPGDSVPLLRYSAIKKCLEESVFTPDFTKVVASISLFEKMMDQQDVVISTNEAELGTLAHLVLARMDQFLNPNNWDYNGKDLKIQRNNKAMPSNEPLSSL